MLLAMVTINIAYILLPILVNNKFLSYACDEKLINLSAYVQTIWPKILHAFGSDQPTDKQATPHAVEHSSKRNAFVQTGVIS